MPFGHQVKGIVSYKTTTRHWTVGRESASRQILRILVRHCEVSRQLFTCSLHNVYQLCIQLNTWLPSSTAVEGWVFLSLRSRLTSAHLEMLTFLRLAKWWLRFPSDWWVWSVTFHLVVLWCILLNTTDLETAATESICDWRLLVCSPTMLTLRN